LCGSCGAELRSGDKFCHECAAPVAAAATAAEYKQVTVLFADVVHSMDIAAAVGAERLREIITELVNRCAAVVLRYSGTVDKFTGDGIMALFGAPIALEDHAIRACLAALEVQHEAARLAADIERRDRIALQLRVGLNSGQVIAGEIGSGALGYTAIGEQVGLAQRMESVAPPSGVMLSESTARLVEHAAVLGEPELVRIKGADAPVPARRLLGMSSGHAVVARHEARLVGRRSQMAALDAMVERTIDGRGGVVNVVGPPGIGKSRIAREAAAAAAGRGVEVCWTFCESHASDIPFHAVRRLLRVRAGVADLDSDAARMKVRARIPEADPQDLLLLDDLLGIADPEVPPPRIDPDARRRRLTALINTAATARIAPTLFIIEDAQWIDAVSESMLADFLTAIPHTKSMVLITSRPEYQGVLTRAHGAQTIALGPLGDSDTAALMGELLGSDPSVGELAAIIAERAAGNPFFAEEMVRELVQRGMLHGDRGNYLCHTNAADVAVPATVQAAIEARIDRLTAPAKQTLNAAAVIGARFGPRLLAAALGIDAVLDEPLAAELIDQVRFIPGAEYAFRHPLIRAVAYESQLKSDRAELHRRLAAAIESDSPEPADQNAALIAEHLEAAGELHAAYSWHMRAGTWSAQRNIAAAQVSWEHARKIADRLPGGDPDRTAIRIAPRTMLCVSGWRAVQANSFGRFEELRALCELAGDKVSLAIGMTGLAAELLFHGRAREASRLASEQMALLDSIGDPTLTIGAAHVAIIIKHSTGEMADVLRWTQTVIDLAEGDPAIGANFGTGSPLADALLFRGVARFWLEGTGWQQDLVDAVAMAQSSDPVTHALTVAGKYGFTIPYGVLRAGDCAVREIEEMLRVAERSADDTALGIIKFFLGATLVHRDNPSERDRGLELYAPVGEFLRARSRPYLVPIVDAYVARERARRGDREGALSVMRRAVNEIFRAGQFGHGIPATAVLVETLLDHGAGSDVTEAEAATDRLAASPVGDGVIIGDITLLRLRALLTWARGDDIAYWDYRDRYRAMAVSLGFEGHIAWADAMP
jgi:class 3 adenylate cyclase